MISTLLLRLRHIVCKPSAHSSDIYYYSREASLDKNALLLFCVYDLFELYLQNSTGAIKLHGN